jgi:hypothetical protein
VFEDPTNVIVFAYRISRFPIVCSKDISTIWGGFFKGVSCKVGGTLEEICLLRRGGPRDTVPSTHVCTIRVDC